VCCHSVRSCFLVLYAIVLIRFRFFHKIAYYIVVNLPFFIIRLIIWHLHDKHVSVFLVKNVLGLFLAVQHLHELLVDISGVIKSDVQTDDGAAIAGESGTAEMRVLTAAGEADRPVAVSEIEMAAIRS